MVNFSVNKRLLKQLEEIKELSSKCENLSNIKIMVGKDVYDKAEKMAKELNTDVEGIFAIAAYRLIGTKICPFTHEICYKRDREKIPPTLIY